MTIYKYKCTLISYQEGYINMSVNYAVLKDGQLRKYFRRSDAIRSYAENNCDKLLSFTLDLFPIYTYIINKPNFDIRNIREDDTLNVTTYGHRQSVKKYDSNNTIQVKMKLNQNTDADIIEQLDSVQNKQGYIKELIRRDMENRKIDKN